MYFSLTFQSLLLKKIEKFNSNPLKCSAKLPVHGCVPQTKVLGIKWGQMENHLSWYTGFLKPAQREILDLKTVLESGRRQK